MIATRTVRSRRGLLGGRVAGVVVTGEVSQPARCWWGHKPPAESTPHAAALSSPQQPTSRTAPKPSSDSPTKTPKPSTTSSTPSPPAPDYAPSQTKRDD
jgi:hypothetical protein